MKVDDDWNPPPMAIFFFHHHQFSIGLSYLIVDRFLFLTSSSKTTFISKLTSNTHSHGKRGEKLANNELNLDSMKYIKKKQVGKGVQRFKCHPSDGWAWLIFPNRDMVESTHGKAQPVLLKMSWKLHPYNWRGRSKLCWRQGWEESKGKELVVAKVEVAKVAEDREGVARIEVHPLLQVWSLVVTTDKYF